MILTGLLLFTAAAHLIPVNESKFQDVLRANRGKLVLVDFWATWCEPCREEMPKLVALRARKTFVLVTVSADEPEQEADAVAFLRNSRVVTPAYIKRIDDNQRFIDSIDPQWSGALPALFLYDRQGRKVKSWIGETEIADVEAALRTHSGKADLH